MKFSKVVLYSLMLIALVSLINLSSCKKDKNETPSTPDTDVQSAADNSQSEMLSNETENMAYGAISKKFNYKSNDNYFDQTMGNCGVVTFNYDTIHKYYKVVINFSDSSCTGLDGRKRLGKVLISFKGNYFEKGFTDTITFDNFYINSKKIEGTHIVTNNGANSSGNINWTIEAKNMKITKTNGKTHTWNSTRNRELVMGDAGGTYLNLKYSITGSATGTNVNGLNYTATITKPVIRLLSCHWISAGTIEVVPTGKATRTLDYGSESTCDDKATVTIDGKSYDITLP